MLAFCDFPGVKFCFAIKVLVRIDSIVVNDRSKERSTSLSFKLKWFVEKLFGLCYVVFCPDSFVLIGSILIFFFPWKKLVAIVFPEIF